MDLNLLAVLSLLPTLSHTADMSYRYLTDHPLHVTSVILEPYMMPNPAYQRHRGGPRYVGYIPDLVEEIARILDIGHVITTSPDNSFGHRRNDGNWDGMIGELVRQQADIAAGPMYKTSQRARVADFTTPFMRVDATLLLRKPPPGTDFNIRTVQDLINQSEIKYGTLDRGVIIHAFKNTNSTALRIMWRNMMRFEPSTFTFTNEEGIERVRREKYGYVLPHTIGEYMSMQEPCDLITVDRFLLNRGYSLAVQRGSPLLEKLNHAIRTLEANGKLLELYRKWWIGRSQCNGGKPSKMHGAPLASTGKAPSGECYPFFVLMMCSIIQLLCGIPSYGTNSS